MYVTLCSFSLVAHILTYLDGFSTSLSSCCDDPSVMKLSPDSAHKKQASYSCVIATGVYGCVGMGMWQSGEGVV